MGMRVHEFKNCKVRAWPETKYLETYFTEEAKVPAAPNYDVESIARATSLGYNGDTWKMSREHEVLHTIVSEWLGYPYSPTLHAVAHNYKPPKGTMRSEEIRVMAFQAYLNEGRWHESLECIDNIEDLVVESYEILEKLFD